jgi:transcriptional regulator with GAF, ATPase, and Fis domain
MCAAPNRDGDISVLYTQISVNTSGMDPDRSVALLSDLVAVLEARDLRSLAVASKLALAARLAPAWMEVAQVNAEGDTVVGFAIERGGTEAMETRRPMSQALLSAIGAPSVLSLPVARELATRGEIVRASAAGANRLVFLPAEHRGQRTGHAVLGLDARSLPLEASPDLLVAMARLYSAALASVELVARLAHLSRRAHRENLHLRHDLARTTARENIVGSSAAITGALAAAEAVAAHGTPVLLRGESGTGKELFALYVHERSNRARRPFLKMNCGAIPDGLVESELFGHERGAFTGAHRRHAGVFERAAGGTVLLDEIAELPPSSQVKLLRVLQEGRFQRVGGEELLPADVRIVAATHRDLEAMIERGRFRADLYYRLNVFPIVLPPLRERMQDLPALAAILLARIAARLGRAAAPTLDAQGLARLEGHAWPGNVRELENLLERAAILSPGPTLIIPPFLPTAPPRERSAAHLKSVIREHIEAAVRSCNGRIYGPEGAAARLGMPPSTLQSKLRRLRIPRSGRRARLGAKQPV